MTIQSIFAMELHDRIKNTVLDNKYIILSSIITGIMTHMFAFTNKLVNFDEARALFRKGASIASGRWGLELTPFLFPNFSTPWIYGIISIFLVCVATCVIINILHIHNRVLQCIFSGVMMTSLSLIGTVTYMFTLTSYMLAFLLSVVAVKCIRGGNTFTRIVAIFASIISLSIYQPYIAVTSSLLLVCIFYDTLQKDFDLAKEIKRGMYYLAHIILSGLIYIAITCIILKLSETGFNSYANTRLSNVNFLLSIKRAYTIFIEEIKCGSYGFMGTLFCRVFILVAFATSVFRWLRIKPALINILLEIIVVILLPLSIASMTAIFGDTHALMLYSFIAFFALLCVIFDQKTYPSSWSMINENVFSLALCLVIISNIYYGNCAYLRVYLSNETSKSFFTSMITRIESLPEYSKGTKIAIIGECDNIYDFPEFDRLPYVVGTHGFSVNDYSKEDFIKYYIGFQGEFASQSECDTLADTTKFREMSEYPYYNSIGVINDTIVVKFGAVEKGE